MFIFKNWTTFEKERAGKEMTNGDFSRSKKYCKLEFAYQLLVKGWGRGTEHVSIHKVCENLEKEKGNFLLWSPSDTIIPGCSVTQSRGVEGEALP